MDIKAKKYTFLDCITIPFKVGPVYMLIIIMSNLINALIPSFQIIVTAKFVDTAIAIFNGTALRNDIILPLILIMSMIAYQYIQGTLINIINLKLMMKLEVVFNDAVITKRSKLNYFYIEDNETWDLMGRACVGCANSFIRVQNNIFSAVQLVISVISVLIIIMAQVWWVAIAIVLIAIPLFYISIKAGKTNYDAFKESSKLYRRAGYLSEILTTRDNVDERSMFSYTNNINYKWYEKYEVARKMNLKVTLKNFIKMKSSSIITVILSIVIIAVLIPPLASGALSIGMFMGLVTGTFSLVGLMSWQLTYITSEFSNSFEYLKDFTTFANLTEKENSIDLPEKMPNFVLESIEFRNVTFAYPNTDREILKNCSFILNSKLQYAFVGINGAGKTTLTKILTGLYDNYEGNIYINNKDLREYKLPELKTIFAVVYQDFAKYNIAFKDGITLGNVLENSDEKLDKAISAMELGLVVEKLPDGIDTYLGKVKEDGTDLSGGEWQRIALARTIYGNAKMYILDEPTAALDPIAESRIYEMFGEISQNKSTIFITHRLGAARLADEILVIDDGKIAEKGSHTQLINKKGIYCEMFESQKGWYQNESK